MSEKCDRCGSVGEDRRTLWHACFYQMSEMSDLPFGMITIDGGVVSNGSPGEIRAHNFYTLRVCKRCRAEWMAAIKKWFFAAPQYEDEDAAECAPSKIGSGIFVRELGATVEISQEEWDKKYPGREPVRVVKDAT